MPAAALEDFRQLTVTLVSLAHDRWPPTAMSLAFLQRIAAPPRHLRPEGGGHFPIEEPGLTTLVRVLQEVRAQAAPRPQARGGVPCR
jgi:hypothetical protein